jgi:hypothetical protein
MEISMLIRPPRSNDNYPDRDLDCQEAIEHDFLAEVRAAETPFIDLAKIKSAIAAYALPAGWRDEDLDEALSELVRCYVLRVQAVRSDDRQPRPAARYH